MADPERAKKDSQVVNFFALTGSAHSKAACRMLMKLTPGINQATFFEISFDLSQFSSWKKEGCSII